MTIKEIRESIANKTVEVRGFLDAKDVEKAKVANEELRALKESLKIAEELGEQEERDLLNQKEKKKRGNEKVEKINEMRAITAQLMGKDITPEERATIVSVDNSAVLPKQFISDIIMIQKGFGSLKGLCEIVPVTKNEGTIPVIDLDQNELAEVAEGADIVDGTLVTTDIPFKCAKVGLIQSLSSELVDDAAVEIENLARNNFANIATAKENTKILKVITDNATAVTATTYEDLEKAIDSALPSVKDGLSTLTNVSGYVLLKNMKDSNKRPLNLITVDANGVEYYHSKPIVYVEDAMLPATEGKNVFYIGNFKEAVKYCDRKAITVARSAEAGFKDDTVKVRILERFIPVKGSVRSLKKIEF